MNQKQLKRTRDRERVFFHRSASGETRMRPGHLECSFLVTERELAVYQGISLLNEESMDELTAAVQCVANLLNRVRAVQAAVGG